MYTTYLQAKKSIYRIMLLSLGTMVLGGCSQSHQLGVETTPQELLNAKLANPSRDLSTTQSISLIEHCAQLGKRNANDATEKTVSIFAGNTGAGKSTTLNALLGCQMKAVRPRELGLPGIARIVVVDPESPRAEVMPIGHHVMRSQTFLPKIVQDPDNPNSAYCDCPGFSDTRGAEINIANAINIRKILQQATGVKVVFLTGYNGLLVDRGSSIRALEDMCLQMFGGIDNLREYQNSVLLGITQAPLYEDDEPVTRSMIRELLTESNRSVSQILANRLFLCDPLERGGEDFWSRGQFLAAIEQMPCIPQEVASNMFQTALTGNDMTTLQRIVRHQVGELRSTLEQDDYPAASRCWNLLKRLRIIEHREVAELMKGQVIPHMRGYAAGRTATFNEYVAQHNFTEAERLLASLGAFNEHFPDETLVDLDNLEATLDTAIVRHIAHCVQLGEQNANDATDKDVVAILGATGVGKSASINGWMGCQMVLSSPEELGIQGVLEDVIVVSPDSVQPEATSIGHGMASHTFMPKIIQDPDYNTRVYLDCPGFSDNRGPEINIANAINTRRVLQQAQGVKAVFLAKYSDFVGRRGSAMQVWENACEHLFGGIDNLRNHQDSVLLGVNRAPLQTSLNRMRVCCAEMRSPIMRILAGRLFLCDPLERGGEDFWSREQFLAAIEQMPCIPQEVASNMFQTALTGDDMTALRRIVRHQVSELRSTLEQDDYPAASRCWDLLKQLRIIEHREIAELMEGQVIPHMLTYATRRTATFNEHAAQHNFTEAERLLTSLRALTDHFPEENLIDLDNLKATLDAAQAQHTAQREAEEEARRAEEERRTTQRRIEREQQLAAQERRRQAALEAELEAARRRRNNIPPIRVQVVISIPCTIM
jgi:hypothetical protein